MKAFDLTGKKFGMLTGVERAGYKVSKKGSKNILWLLKCDCGNFKKSITSLILNGLTWHCGCKAYQNRNRKFDPIVSSFRAKACSYKSHAKLRKFDWELTIEEACVLLNMDCNYCGSKPDKPYNSIKNRTDKEKNNSQMSEIHFESGLIYYNGIDRLDSKLGYTRENSVACCTYCNFAKNNKPVKDFILWLDRLANFRNKK